MPEYTITFAAHGGRTGRVPCAAETLGAALEHAKSLRATAPLPELGFRDAAGVNRGEIALLVVGPDGYAHAARDKALAGPR